MPSLPGRTSRRGLLQRTLAAGGLAALAPALPRPGLARQATPAASPVASPIPGDDAALFRELGDRVRRRMVELRVPGVAVGVIAGGTEYTAGFGVTNVDHPLPVGPDTLFQIGSTTKTYTGTALMRLVEQGTLDLEAPVRTYLPEFRVADEGVSAGVLLRHLVTHTAGWYGDDYTETGDGDDALAAFVAAMAGLAQTAPLGEYFSYNNAAVVLAGRVIEAATGQTYEAAIRELVLAPLGLERTFFFAEEIMTEAFTVGHAPPPDQPDGAPAVIAAWALPRSVNPAGGLISSVVDQLRYARFHLGDGTVAGAPVLGAEAFRRMREPLGPGGSFGSNLLDGVGVLWLLTTMGGERIALHGGSTNGQQSSFLLAPDRGFAVTTLTNAEAGAVLGEEVSRWALELFLQLAPPQPVPIAVAPERLNEYVGDYSAIPALVLSVGAADGGLVLSATQDGQPVPALSGPLPLIGEDLAAFDFGGIPALTDFVRDDAGAVGWLRFSGRLVPRLP